MGSIIEQEKLDRYYGRFAGRIEQWNENVGEYRQKYALLKVLPIKTILRFMKSGPLVLHLLISLLNHEQVSRRTKRMVGAALGYFVFPLDALPEAIIGPLGYVDDVIVGLILVDHLLNGENEEEKELIATLWQGTPEELAVLRTLLKGVDFSRYIGRVLRKIIPMKK